MRPIGLAFTWFSLGSMFQILIRDGSSWPILVITGALSAVVVYLTWRTKCVRS